MSRHRYVRNLDLDAEMASDSEEESGMTGEEQAQMASAMPAARAMLADIKPPIADAAIADSLWHYWFDVEKAVAWLRKDWEKKGESIPMNLQPTPTEQRRRRSAKSARLEASNVTATGPEPEIPLSALQRLSIARKAREASPAPSGDAPTLSTSSTSDAPSTPAGKPMSKLALLAQKRREEAQARASPANAAPPSPASSASATPPGAATPNAEAGPSKPLSKLAQKMAAARLAKLEADAKEATSPPPTDSDTMDLDALDPAVSGPEPATSGLFAFPKQPNKTSPFFNLLTTRCAQTNTVDAKPSSVAHLPYVPNEEELERRVREAFGPDVESPDDIVLKARGGRAGTRALNEAGQEEEKAIVQPKKVKAAVKEKEVVSEVGKAAKEERHTADGAKSRGTGPASKQRKGSSTTVTSDGSRPGESERRGQGESSGLRGGKTSRGSRPANPSNRAPSGDDGSRPLPEQALQGALGDSRPPRARPPKSSDADQLRSNKPPPRKPRAPGRPAPGKAHPPAAAATPSLPPLPTSNDPPTPRTAREKPKAKSKQVKGPP